MWHLQSFSLLYFIDQPTVSIPLKFNSVMKFLIEEYFPAGEARKLGLLLGVPAGRIQTFITNRPHNADGELMDVITYWNDNDGEASWDRLATALKKCGHAVMAKKVFSQISTL